MSVELWEAARSGDHEHARALHEATLPLARAAVWDYPVNFPGGVKATMEALRCDPGVSRAPMHRPPEGRVSRIRDAIEHMCEHGLRETPQ